MEKQRRKIPDEDKLLAKFTLFAELSEEELHGLIEQSATERYAAGERIISAGDSGHCMYVILSGSVRVTIQARQWRNRTRQAHRRRLLRRSCPRR